MVVLVGARHLFGDPRAPSPRARLGRPMSFGPALLGESSPPERVVRPYRSDDPIIHCLLCARVSRKERGCVHRQGSAASNRNVVCCVLGSSDGPQHRNGPHSSADILLSPFKSNPHGKVVCVNTRCTLDCTRHRTVPAVSDVAYDAAAILFWPS